MRKIILNLATTLDGYIEDRHKLILISAKGHASGVTLMTYKADKTTNS
jgi:hypothetical protein